MVGSTPDTDQQHSIDGGKPKKPHRHGGPVWRTKHSKRGTMARPGTSKRGPRWIKIRKRQQQVLDLRVQGLSYEAIGKQVGIHKSQVERDVIACMEAMIKEPAERAFKIEMRRLDELFSAHHEAACAGDVNATYAFESCRITRSAHGVGQGRSDCAVDDQ